MFEMYLTNEQYYVNKSIIKEVMNLFELKWNYSKSGWFMNNNFVIKQELPNDDRLLIVNGDELFIDSFKLLSVELKLGEKPKPENKSLKEFIEKRMKEELEWCKVFGYNLKVAEYFVRQRLIEANR